MKNPIPKMWQVPLLVILALAVIWYLKDKVKPVGASGAGSAINNEARAKLKSELKALGWDDWHLSELMMLVDSSDSGYQVINDLSWSPAGQSLVPVRDALDEYYRSI